MSNVFDLRGAARRAGGFRGLSGLLDDLDTASARWEGITGIDLRGELEAAVPAWVGTVALGTEILSKTDFSDPHSIIDTLASMASLAGPYGEMAASILRLLDDLSEYLVGGVPAFAVQFQPGHFATMDAWIAKNVLSIEAASDEERLKIMYGNGWVPIYSFNDSRPLGHRDFGVSMCGTSGGGQGWLLGRWGGISAPVVDIRQIRHLFSLIAGPREMPIPMCTSISDDTIELPVVIDRERPLVACPAPGYTTCPVRWVDSEEGRSSVRDGEVLFDYLSGGGVDQFVVDHLQDGRCTVWKSAGLSFVVNWSHDIDPGYRRYYVYGTTILVNTTKLPSALLNPIAEYVAFRAKAMGDGIWGATTEGRVADAVFGPVEDDSGLWIGGANRKLFKAWNLLRLIHGSMYFRGTLPVAAVAEAAARSQSAEKTTGKTSGRWSTGAKVVAGFGIAGGIALLTKLFKLW